MCLTIQIKRAPPAGSGGASDAYDGGDYRGGEEVAGGGVDVGGPALVGGGGEGEERRCGPGVGGKDARHVRDEDDRDDAEGRDKQGRSCGRC